MSSSERLIVSHHHQGFFSGFIVIFTSCGLISHVVFSSVLVWTRDARKRTSPEVRIPTATCHFSQRGHKSSPKARVKTQSQEHNTASKLCCCLFDLLAHWTLAEQPAWLIKKKKRRKFATPLQHLHHIEMSSVGCVSYFFYRFTIYSSFILLKQYKTKGIAKTKWTTGLSVMIQLLIQANWEKSQLFHGR